MPPLVPKRPNQVAGKGHIYSTGDAFLRRTGPTERDAERQLK